MSSTTEKCGICCICKKVNDIYKIVASTQTTVNILAKRVGTIETELTDGLEEISSSLTCNCEDCEYSSEEK